MSNLLHIVSPRKDWTNSSVSFKRIKRVRGIVDNKMLLTLCHGLAAVERGFSVNKEVLNPNLQEMSLREIRLIYR